MTLMRSAGWCNDCNLPSEECAHPPVSLLTAYGAYDGQWLSTQTFRPIEYIVPGLIPEGLTFIVAPPKIGKSWFVLDLALACANGGTFLGLDVSQRPVLYLALEDGPRRLQSRGHMLGVHDFPARVTFVNQVRPGDALDLMREYMRENAGKMPLVVVDTLAKIKPDRPASSESYQHDYMVSAALKTVADEHDGAVTVVHHNRKAASDDFVESVSGTQGITGAADTIIVIRRPRNEAQGELHVTSRDGMEGAYGVTFAEGRWSLDGGADLQEAARALGQREAAKRLDDDSRTIVGIVNDRSADGLATTAADVASLMGMDDDDGKKKLRTYLARLSAGDHPYIRRAARGVYEALPTQSVVSGVSVVNSDGLVTTLATQTTPSAHTGPEQDDAPRLEQDDTPAGLRSDRSNLSERSAGTNDVHGENASNQATEGALVALGDSTCEGCGNVLQPAYVEMGRSTHPGCAVTPASESGSTKRNQLVDLVRTHGVTKAADVVEHLPGWTIKSATTVLGQLVDKGDLYRPARGQYDLAERQDAA